MPAPVLSVVIPTRNEAENAPVLVDRLLAVLQGVEAELCFVDDSDDATPEVLDELAERHPGRIRVLARPPGERAGGLSTAVVAGLRMAEGRFVCVMDADLQHPPELIPDMLAAGEEGADLVVASRYAPGGSVGGLDGVVRRSVSRGATLLARLLFSEARRSRDPLSGFFLCRRSLIDGIEFRPVGFKILLELLVLLPNVEVRDVPMRFSPRHAGASKASVGQGIQYLRHLRSLALDVQGSARVWKFGLVGASGLLLFIPVLSYFKRVLPSLAAFFPAFVVSLAWNTVLNRVWTFADLRHSRAFRPWGYLSSALLAGIPMFAAFALLTLTGSRTLIAGGAAAGVAAVVNGLANRRVIKRSPATWARVVADRGLQAEIFRLGEQVHADRAYIVPADRRSEPGSSLAGVVGRAVTLRRAICLTEAPSFRPQRRTNIEAVSLLVIPVVREDAVVAVVVCERHATRGFSQEDLTVATQAVHLLSAHVDPTVVAEAAVLATPRISSAR